MDITKTLHVTTRAEWRAWLEQNGEREPEIWLIFYKGHTGEARLPYDEAVEEALCFGWIDGLVKRVDDEKYAQRFSPRKLKSQWSASNRRRVAKLIGEGRMTAAGLAKITYPDPASPPADEKREDPVVPPEVERALMANELAWTYYNQMAPSHRRNYLRWVLRAKRQETRDRRLQEVIERLAQNKKPGLL